jgi:radical SAM-linked protein
VKIRIRFSKQGKIRWTSHRDVARMWERALRRAQVPVAYSEGFSPRPKLSFGLALPTGSESVAEYLDMDVAGETSVEGLAALLDPALPVGVDVGGAAVLGAGAPSLQHDVVACRWEFALPEEGDAIEVDQPGRLEAKVAEVLAADTIVLSRERKGQAVSDDVRPAILGLSVLAWSDWPGSPLPGPARRLGVELATVGRGLRPAELLGHLGVDPASARTVRTHQWIERDGARREPIPATDAPACTGAGEMRRESLDERTSTRADARPAGEPPGDGVRRSVASA